MSLKKSKPTPRGQKSATGKGLPKAADGRRSLPAASGAQTRQSRPVETTAEILSNTRLAENGFLLTLRAGVPACLPGQFVMLGLPESSQVFLRRPFSVLDHEVGKDRLRLFYSVAGKGTGILSELCRGQELPLLGPLGSGFPDSRKPILVLVGGGRGAVPLVFLANRGGAGNKMRGSRRVFLLVGAKSRGELIPPGLARASKVFVSTEDGSAGKKGVVIDLLESVSSSPDFRWSDVQLFGCGPAGMLKALYEIAAVTRIPYCASLEARMACGLGVCHGCAVKSSGSGYLLVCRDGPVLDSTAIDWETYS
ncbi:MAG: dihydroorotate dehydrogenase electron transfer subunit [Candidatus Eisenbacteria bacterium]